MGRATTVSGVIPFPMYSVSAANARFFFYGGAWVKESILFFERRR
jgi:hypothetical protein